MQPFARYCMYNAVMAGDLALGVSTLKAAARQVTCDEMLELETLAHRYGTYACFQGMLVAVYGC